MDNKAKLKKYFLENEKEIKERIIALTTEIVKEKTVNVVSEKLNDFPFLKIRGEEYRVGEIVKREFDALQVKYDEFSRMEGRPNIIAKLGKDETGKRLLMASHMDVVPAGEGWDSDPYTVTEKDGYLYGRGVLDDKGPLVSTMVAVEVLKKLGLEDEIKGELQIAALSDEEAEDPDGIDYGVGYLVEENLINSTHAIIPDIGENMKAIDVAEKGRTVFKVTSIGKQAHGSTPEKGINAVYMMAKFVNEVENLKFDYDVHPVLGDPSLNLGEIHGGAAPNIVPGTCFVYLDIRTVPGMSKDNVKKAIESCIEKVKDGKFEIDIMAWSEPHGIDPDNELVHAVQANSVDILGLKPKTFGMGGGTFAKTLNLAGITAIGWGPGDDEAYHVANEYVEIKQLVDFAQLTCLVALDILK